VKHAGAAYQRWIVTFGGAGMSPLAPGTAGSLAGTIVLYALHMLMPDFLSWQAILLGVMAIASFLCVRLGRWTIEYYGRKDPGACVLDEVAGMAVTMLLLPMSGAWHGTLTFAAACMAFRMFDVLKPWPCRRLERFPNGWGILADDLAAGVYANIVCQIVLRKLIGVH
jgi:phosphatidylglycerophosphatase A